MTCINSAPDNLDAIQQIGVSVVPSYRWHKECGDMKVDHFKRLKQLEKENARLKSVQKVNTVSAR